MSIGPGTFDERVTLFVELVTVAPPRAEEEAERVTAIAFKASRDELPGESGAVRNVIPSKLNVIPEEPVEVPATPMTALEVVIADIFVVAES